MKVTDDRKRLQILQVKAPEPRPAPPVGEEAPRQRALATKQRLLAVAAAGAALQPGCSSPSVPPEIHADQATTAATTAAATPSAEPSAAESAGIARNPKVIPTGSAAPSASVATAPSASAAPLVSSQGVGRIGPPIGYGVVDPMPPPARVPPKTGGKKGP